MISILIPSRLASRPQGGLWLERALRSIGQQLFLRRQPVEIVVGLDRGVAPPPVSAPKNVPLRFANVGPDQNPGQAAAINAAACAATGSTIAILEDDDAWHRKFLGTAAAALKDFDFVSSSQLLVNIDGMPIEPMYFPTPSGWVMQRTVWERVGGFNEDMRFHVDMDWLGRLNAAGIRRGHLVEAGFPLNPAFLAKHRKWLAHVAAREPNPPTLVQHSETVPLVVRTTNPVGGTGRIRKESVAGMQSRRELAMIRKRFGGIPW